MSVHIQADLDRIVGKIAGAIYCDIADQFPSMPLMLIPALTFKVHKIMETVNSLERLSPSQKVELAKDIQIAIIPMLFSYEIDSNVIEKITPKIEVAALNAIKGGVQDENETHA